MTTICADDVLDPAVTASPGAMDTEATVPLMGLTRLAPATASWASVRLAWAVSTEAWSTATCWAVAFLPELSGPLELPVPPEPVEPVEPVEVVELPVAAVIPPPVPVPPVAPDEPVAVLEDDSRAMVSAFSAWLTCLMSPPTWFCAEVACPSAAAQEAVPLPPDGVEGVVVEVLVGVVVELVEVGVDPAQAVVARGLLYIRHPTTARPPMQTVGAL